MKSSILRYSTLLALLGAIAWLVKAPDWEPAIAAITLLAAFIVTDERLSPTPDISGRWEYEVTTHGKEFSHKGDCHIHQCGRVIRIVGYRRFTCALKDRRPSCRVVEVPWGSDWAEICGDNTLRLDYHIAVPNPKVDSDIFEAICRVKFALTKPKEMKGHYYMLPPFDEKTLNCRFGTITFRRLAETEELLPPAAHDDEEAESEELANA